MTLVAPRIVNDLPYVSTVNHEPLWAARCLHRIRQPKHFVCVAVLHPTAQDLRCLAMHDFFSIGLLVSYRFMFFFIDWKLPPPACPGTTGIYFLYIIYIYIHMFLGFEVP